MAEGLLASYYLQFGEKGLRNLQQSVDDIGTQLKKADATAEPVAQGMGRKIGEGITRGLASVGRAFDAMATAGKRAFGGLAQSALTWVRAGLQGTTTGAAFGVQMQLLSREVANLVIGPLNSLLEGIRSVTAWFRSLDGDTQRLLGRFITGVVVISTLSAALPRLTGGFRALGGVLSVLSAHPILALAAAMVGLMASTEEGRSAFGEMLAALAPIGRALAELGSALAPLISALAEVLLPIAQALVPVFEAVAAVVTTIVNAIMAAVNWLKELLNIGQSAQGGLAAGAAGRPGGGRQELRSSGGGFEAVTEAFRRFNVSAGRTESSIPQRQLQAQERSNSTLDRIEANTRRGFLGGLNATIREAGMPPVPPAVS